MSKRARLVLAGTLAIAFLVAVATRAGNDSSPAPRSHGPRSGTDSALVQSPVPQPQRVTRPRGRRVRARAQARRFLRALLTYEVRGAGAGVRAAFRATATRSLQEILGSGPRPGPARTRGRVVSLRLFGPVHGQIKASAILARRAERSLLEFVLAKGPTGWRVRELHP